MRMLFRCACDLPSPLPARLGQAAEESGKPGDVDLVRLLASHECGSTAVQRLLGLEQHPVRLVSGGDARGWDLKGCARCACRLGWSSWQLV